MLPTTSSARVAAGRSRRFSLGINRRRRITKDALFTSVLNAIDGTKGRVALASGTYALVEAPPLRVHLERAPVI
ncbi:MAG: hypothetical protein ABIQ10_11415 [Gemmatimonadaceae bacterium]